MNRNSLTGNLLLFFLLLIECNKTELKTIPDSEIKAWFDAEYEELLQMCMLQLTAQGRYDRFGEIDDMSEVAEDKRLTWMEEIVREMESKFDFLNILNRN